MFNVKFMKKVVSNYDKRCYRKAKLSLIHDIIYAAVHGYHEEVKNFWENFDDPNTHLLGITPLSKDLLSNWLDKKDFCILGKIQAVILL